MSGDEKLQHIFRVWEVAESSQLIYGREQRSLEPKAITEGNPISSKPGHPKTPESCRTYRQSG
jgi:hypothetical protein